jgi:REP element-mobilizing transposase RayT
MPRRPRESYPGSIHHVVSAGVDRQSIFRDGDDRRQFLKLLADAIGREGLTCLAYCLMGNHFHLVVRVDSGDLSEAMRWLNREYVRWFNRKYARKGHLVETRYWSRRIKTESYLLAVVRYVALNPVKDGFCGAPEDWLWSSHAALVGLRKDLVVEPQELLGLFGDDLTGARSSYARFVAGEASVRHTDPRLASLAAQWDRDAAIAEAHRVHGFSETEIAEVLGCHRRTVTRSLERTKVCGTFVNRAA